MEAHDINCLIAHSIKKINYKPEDSLKAGRSQRTSEKSLFLLVPRVLMSKFQ
jgi:hypothetical protein